jgi:hypothetical protein
VSDPSLYFPRHLDPYVPGIALADCRPILGIDPGITGGVAFLYPSGRVVALDLPNVGGEVDIDTLAATIDGHDPRVAIIERAGAMPQQGVS